MNTLFFLLLIEVLFFWFVSFFKFKRVLTINAVFSFVWSISLILNYYYSYVGNIIVISNKIIEMVIILIFFFNITYIVLSNSKKKEIYIDEININYKLLRIGACIAILLYLPNVLQGIAILMKSNFSFSVVRENYLSLMGAGRGVYVYLTQYIPDGISNAVILLSVFDLTKKKYSTLKYSITLMLFNIIGFGGRIILLNFIIYYILMFFLFKIKSGKKKINRKIIYFFIVLLVFLTFSRGVGKDGFFGMLSKYFYQQYSFLQLILDKPNLFSLFDGPHYGYITLGFLSAPFTLFINAAIPSFRVASNYIDVYSQIFYNIGINGNINLINNNTTSLYPFIKDFGVQYYFIGAIILAIIVVFTEKKKNKSQKNKLFYSLIYILILSVVIWSPICYNLISISASFTIIFVFILTRNIKFK